MAITSPPAPIRFVERDELPFLRDGTYATSPMHRNRLACIARMVTAHRPPSPDVKVLDIGCGLGHIAAPIAALGYRVKGIDLHTASIDAARHRYPLPNLTFEAASLDTIDLKGFDILILSEVLEHVPDWQSMLRFLAANMARNARLVLTVPNGWGPMELVCRPSYRLKHSPAGTRFVKTVKRWLNTADLTTANEQTPHIHFFRCRGLRRTANSCGLMVSGMEGHFFLWPLWEVLRSRRVSETWARRDFAAAQRLPMAWRAYWCFAMSTTRGVDPR